MRASLAAAVLVCLAFFACGKPTETKPNSNAEASSPAPYSGTDKAPDSETEKASKAKPEVTVVPAGTVLTVRLGQAVGSKISQPGQSFMATLARPINVNGESLVPAGTQASGTIVDAQPLGRFKGGARLQLKLISLDIHGSDRQIVTSSVVRTEKGKGKRTAIMTGGGAGFGALIGGLAGGGKGAAIGAIAGAGAGAGGAAFTGNTEIVLPAESALSFRLERPIEIR